MVHIVVMVQGGTDLLQVVQALNAVGRFTDLLDGRKDDRDQHGNDAGEYDKGGDARHRRGHDVVTHHGLGDPDDEAAHEGAREAGEPADEGGRQPAGEEAGEGAGGDHAHRRLDEQGRHGAERRRRAPDEGADAREAHPDQAHFQQPSPRHEAAGQPAEHRRTGLLLRASTVRDFESELAALETSTQWSGDRKQVRGELDIAALNGRGCRRIAHRRRATSRCFARWRSEFRRGFRRHHRA